MSFLSLTSYIHVDTSAFDFLALQFRDGGVGGAVSVTRDLIQNCLVLHQESE